MNNRIDYTRYYKKWHSDTDEHILQMKNYYRNLLSEHLPADKTRRILDVGCGMGFALLSLREMGYTNIEGIDADEGQVRSCLAKQLRVIQTDDTIEFLCKRSTTYDLIICLDVLEHIACAVQLRFVRALQSSLKPGGRLVCTVPNANSALAGRWRYNDWTHYTSFTEHSIDFLLFNAGFDDIRIFTTEFNHPPSWRPVLSKRVFGMPFWKSVFHWRIFRFVRVYRRIEMIAELGWEEGSVIPLSLNILVSCQKTDEERQKADSFDYTRIYRRWHSDTPRHIQEMKGYYRALLAGHLPPDKNASILDVGCGMGFTIMSLHDMGYTNVEGIDIDSGQVQSCIQKRLKVVQVDDSIQFLLERNETYDVILCLDVMEHIACDTQLDFARAMRSSLKSGGKLICKVPNANSGLASRWRYIDWTHQSSFTEHSIDFLLFNAGFTNIEVFETEFFQAPHLRIFSRTIFRPFFWKSVLHWSIFKIVRAHQRIRMIAELGREQAASVPLSLNMIVKAVKM